MGLRVAPSAATIGRVIGLVCPGALADLTGADPAGSDSVAVDGKAARGSRHNNTPAGHLLAAMTCDGRTVTQLRVPDKTNEITCFAALLAPFDLTGVTVTAEPCTPLARSTCWASPDQRDHKITGLCNDPGQRTARRNPWKKCTSPT